MTKFLSWRGHAFIALPIRLYLGIIFLFACVHKILEPAEFALDIATYQILPLSLINLMAIVLPWLELIAGMMLVIGLRSRIGALLVAGMMAMFTVAVAIALVRGLDMSCGCFASQGAVDDPISWATVARDVAWLALALYIWIFDRSSLGIDRLLTWRLSRTAPGA